MAFDVCRSILEDLVGQALQEARPTTTQPAPANPVNMGTITLTLADYNSSDDDDDSCSESRSSTPMPRLEPQAAVESEPVPVKDTTLEPGELEESSADSDSESMFLAIGEVVGNYSSHPVTPARKPVVAAPTVEALPPDQQGRSKENVLEKESEQPTTRYCVYFCNPTS